MADKGYVYILTNPAFREDWVKIGKSSRSVEQRVKELDNTSVPLPFEIYATMETSKYSEAEKLVHRSIERFTKLRIRDNREFFKIHPEEALEIFRDIAGVLDDAVIEETFKKTVREGDSLDSMSYAKQVHHIAERDYKAIWLIPSNSKFYDLQGKFRRDGYVYWAQYYKFKKGDIAYIYSSAPDSCLKYKVEIESSEEPFNPDMESEKVFYVNKGDFEQNKKHNRFAKFRLLETTNSDQVSLAHLLENGLSMAPRGSVLLSGELLKYIEEHF